MSQESPNAAPAPKQSVRLVIAAVAVVLLLASLGQTIVSTALPVIVGDLGGLDHLTWVVTAYLLAATVMAPIYGKLGDLYGRKVVLQAAILIFLGGSVLAGVANSMLLLIIARAVQGLGGGGLMVTAMAVVADVLPARQRGRVQGMFSAVFGVSTVIGPLIGGVIVERISWHWIFFVNLPIGLLAFLVITTVLKSPSERVRQRVDYLGAALLAGALSSIVLFTSLGGVTFPWGSTPIIVLIALSVIFTVAFIIVEAHVPEPVLPLRLFGNRIFVVSNAVAFMTGVAMFAGFTFLPLYLQIVQGLSPTVSGLSMLPMVVGMLVSSIFAGQVMARTGRYKWLPIASTAILVVGLGILTLLSMETGLLEVSIAMLLIGAGIGPVNTVTVTAVQNAAPVSMVGVATAGTTMFRQIGGSVGVALCGAVFAARLAAVLGDALPAEGAGAVFDPVGILALPEATRAVLLAGFVEALRSVFLLAAAAAVAAFVIAWLMKEIPLSTVLRSAQTEPVEPEAAPDARK